MSTHGEQPGQNPHTGGTPGTPGSSGTPLDPQAYWEALYGESPRWSGNVNAILAQVAEDILPGTALDLGCGEGADVLWLAHRGWHAVGVDIAQGAIIRARATAEATQLEEGRAQFLRSDLSVLTQERRPEELTGPFELVTASYFQSPVALDRQRILQAAAALVSRSGHLLLTSHAAAPSWADPEAWQPHDDEPGHAGHDHTHADHQHADFPTPQDELTMLSLDPHEWETIRAEVVTRDTTAPDGSPGQLDDTIVLLRRRGIPATGTR